MRIEQLYYLVAISKTKSIGLAAERLYISQPSLSEAINKLEQELGVLLLKRSNRGVDLTEAGRKVIKASEQILGILDELKSELELNNDLKPSQLTGSLTLYATPDISSTVLVDIISVFCQHNPKVNLTVKEVDILDLIQNVIDGKADLGIIPMLDNLLENDELSNVFKKELHFEKLFFCKPICLVGKSSPLASRKSVSMKEIVNKYPLAFYTTNSLHYWFSKLLSKYGDANIYLKSGSAELIENAIIKGQAISLATELYLKREGKQSLIKNKEIIPIPIKEDIRITLGWIRSSNNQLSTSAQEFIKLLKSQY